MRCPARRASVIIANSEPAGSITFAGANTYTGHDHRRVPARPSSVDGSIVSPLTVAGTLGGSGVVGGNTTIAERRYAVAGQHRSAR